MQELCNETKPIETTSKSVPMRYSKFSKLLH